MNTHLNNLLGYNRAAGAEVRRIRRDIPGMETQHRIKLGRDRLHALLKENGMLAKRKAQKVTTTQSNQTHFKYPNKVKDVIPSRANERWPGRRCGKRFDVYLGRPNLCISLYHYEYLFT